jgi:hypothetical protein
VFCTQIDHLISKECGFPVGHSKINSEEIREFLQIIFKTENLCGVAQGILHRII